MFMSRKSQRGFTIVELIVMISVIVILSVFIVSNVKTQRMKARDQARVSDINTIRIALEDYRLACGEYPSRIEPDTNNGCPYGQKLSDFLPTIPVDEPHSNLYGDSWIEEGKNNYLYAGLSNTPNGKCYDYHVAAVLEMNEANGRKSRFLREDHDVDSTSRTKYKYRCRGSNNLFGEDAEQDDYYGLYDFRSYLNITVN